MLRKHIAISFHFSLSCPFLSSFPDHLIFIPLLSGKFIKLISFNLLFIFHLFLFHPVIMLFSLFFEFIFLLKKFLFSIHELLFLSISFTSHISYVLNPFHFLVSSHLLFFLLVLYPLSLSFNLSFLCKLFLFDLSLSSSLSIFFSFSFLFLVIPPPLILLSFSPHSFFFFFLFSLHLLFEHDSLFLQSIPLLRKILLSTCLTTSSLLLPLNFD